MIVTEIKQKGKSETYYVSLDESLFGEFQLEILVKHHIKVGVDIDEETLKQIKEESDELTCFSRALKYISSRLKTEKQMKEYLQGLNYSDKAIQNAITKLKNYGYINDDYYAKTFAEIYGKSKGKKYLQRELTLKGVNAEIVSQTLESQNDTVACKEQCAKKLKNMQLPLSQKDKEKVYRFLLSRGFDFSTIKQCLSEYVSGEDDNAWD